MPAEGDEAVLFIAGLQRIADAAVQKGGHVIPVLDKEGGIEEGVLRRVEVEAFQAGHGHVQVAAGDGGVVVGRVAQGAVGEEADVDGAAGLLIDVINEFLQRDAGRGVRSIGGSEVEHEALIRQGDADCQCQHEGEREGENLFHHEILLKMCTIRPNS